MEYFEGPEIIYTEGPVFSDGVNKIAVIFVSSGD